MRICGTGKIYTPTRERNASNPLATPVTMATISRLSAINLANAICTAKENRGAYDRNGTWKIFPNGFCTRLAEQIRNGTSTNYRGLDRQLNAFFPTGFRNARLETLEEHDARKALEAHMKREARMKRMMRMLECDMSDNGTAIRSCRRGC